MGQRKFSQIAEKQFLQPMCSGCNNYLDHFRHTGVFIHQGLVNQIALHLEPLERATLLQGLMSLVRLATERHPTLFTQGFIEVKKNIAHLQGVPHQLVDLVTLLA
jgi:hypothetical protein